MANYQEAFRYVFEENFKYNYDINNQTMHLESLYSQGFNDKEIQVLFKQIYGVELWRQFKGGRIKNQKTAELLLLLNVNGLLAIMLHEMQKYYGISPSSQMCEQTLHQINQIPADKLHDWIIAGINYFSLVGNMRKEHVLHQ
ncbi:hypothetical protein [Pseudoalteromonas umbrosa]|uniref:hypothetical protein n=1 Tax=Pseudoalteromonas umbrosa TaxID=3048489 RepID=UPI0024C28058|nr:hypothetical protein [Pseudoalteromonas sp. B95]MDK1286621.1 hypothetical protein [Pseudoalteromonas sp. B95]